MKLFQIEPYDPEKITYRKSSRVIENQKKKEIESSYCDPTGLYFYLTTCPYTGVVESTTCEYGDVDDTTSMVYGYGFSEEIATGVIGIGSGRKKLELDKVDTGLIGIGVYFKSLVKYSTRRFEDNTETGLLGIAVDFREKVKYSSLQHKDETSTELLGIEVHFYGAGVAHAIKPENTITSLLDIAVDFRKII